MVFYRGAWDDYVQKRVCDEAGDCSEEEVTSVEYVRYRLNWRYAIGRLNPLRYTRISRGSECEPAKKPVCFSDAA